MDDLIRGFIIKVLSLDTFEIKITHIDPKNKYKYRAKEIIRTYKSNFTELLGLNGNITRVKLEFYLLMEEVTCYVKHIDTEKNIIADVVLI